jgi:hypothetical protein
MGAEVGAYPTATTPLNGNERWLCDQNGTTSNCLSSQIAAYTFGVQGLAPYTVAGLPACTSSNKYTWAVTTDAVLATQAPNGPVTGGSNGVLTVFCNGTAWVGKL